MTNLQVLKLIRDARVAKNGERQLLDALALRCNPKLHYVTLTSYKQLASDTLLSIPTLQQAAQELQRADFIRRFTGPRTGWESPEDAPTIRIHINIRLLTEKADAVRSAEAIRRTEVEHMPANPFPFPNESTGLPG
jgi:DNA-binding IscR family transcriptional regulator